MAEVKNQQGESILSREQLQGIERFQARFAEMERELSSLVGDFLSVLNRHYFNRENGFVKEQQQNLREVVALEGRLDKLGSTVSTQARELKNYMVQLQNTLHGLPAKPEAEQGEAEKVKATPAAEPATGKEAARESTAKGKTAKEISAKGEPRKSDLVNRSGEGLADSAQKGGEISLKLLFEELHLSDQANAGVLGEINQAMRKLLYDRKLVGYSKTALVFGRDRSIDQLLEDLKPIFGSESLCGLLRDYKLIEPGEAENLKLACNEKRELLYLLT